MIYRVGVTKEGWTNYVIVEATSIEEAQRKVDAELLGHISSVVEDNAIMIIT